MKLASDYICEDPACAPHRCALLRTCSGDNFFWQIVYPDVFVHSDANQEVWSFLPISVNSLNANEPWIEEVCEIMRDRKIDEFWDLCKKPCKGRRYGMQVCQLLRDISP